MKVFISWSGEVSHKVALALKEWLADVLPSVDSFLSSEDLRKGSRWRNVLTNELAGSKFGVICLTRSNLQAPWVLFEAGSISSAFEDSQVCTLLLGGLRPSDVKEPLANFNHTAFDREDMRKLALSINEGAGDGMRDLASLHRSFDKFWSDLEEKVEAALKLTENLPAAPRSSTDEKLEELIERVRSMEKLAQNRGYSVAEFRVPSHMHGAYWAKFLEQLGLFSQPLFDVVKVGQLAGILNQRFFISFPEEYRREHGTALIHPPSQALLNWAASEAYGSPLRVEISSPFAGWNVSNTEIHRTLEIIKQNRAQRTRGEEEFHGDASNKPDQN